jgi:DNA-binding NarL/FixJ family response regulator
LLKTSASAELVDAVRAVHEGKPYLSHKISDIVVDYVNQYNNLNKKSPIAHLTERELDVLHLLVEDKTNTEIADILEISVKTVPSYRSRLMRKLGVKTISGLIKFAIEHDLVPSNDGG